jgi:hypothetical protein
MRCGILLVLFLKKSDKRFSTSGFYHGSVFPGPPSIPMGLLHFSNIRNFFDITADNDTDEKLFTGVNDTGDKLSLVSFLQAINYPGVPNQFIKPPWYLQINLSPVTTIPEIINRR